MIPDALLIQIKLFSVSLGLKEPAKTTFNKSDTNTNTRQVLKTMILYLRGLVLSSALAPIAAVQANQNKKTLGFKVFIK